MSGLSRAGWYALVAWGFAFANVVVWIVGSDARGSDTAMTWFTIFAAAQLVFGGAAVVRGNRDRRGGTKRTGAVAAGSFAFVGAVFGWLAGMVTMGLSSGGAWGRPLRVRGRQIHPSLRRGADWTDGARPDPTGLDLDTRRALEALWLHDAQKEHASVPAFARVSWLLAAAGAPAELLVWAHRAAVEEIEHARACFALAAGYGGRSFTVEPMPELLLGGLDGKADPRVTLAIESLSDGCQLEDFNADVAAACAATCEEPVTRAVLETIAREERSHAELSWAILAWLVANDRDVVAAPLAKASAALASYPRPTAVSRANRAIVAKASPQWLRAHGRLGDDEWALLWDVRLAQTRRRLEELHAGRRPSVRRAA